MKLVLNLLLVVSIFIGCSSKQYFEPENTYDLDTNIMELENSIKVFNKDGVTLENNKFISKDGISKYSLPQGYNFLNKVNHTVLASNDKAQLLIKDDSGKESIILFEYNVIAVSKKQNLLALLFSNNVVGLYNIDDKKFTFKEYLKSSVLNDIRIASPIFIDDIVLLPSLDGKIVVTSIETKKIIKTINVDPNSKINNIIYLNTFGDTMIAATSNKVISLLDGSFAVKDYDIKDIVASKSNVFVATLDGKIIKLDFTLDEQSVKKFKFAKIYALAYTDTLYALESQGYLIKLNDELTENKVYDFDFNENKKSIVLKDTLYFDSSYIKLKLK